MVGAAEGVDMVDATVEVAVKENVDDRGMRAAVVDTFVGAGIGDSSSWMDIFVACGCV